MTAQDILKLAQSHGVQIHAENGQLLLQADAPPPREFIDILKQHKPDLLAFLSAGNAPTIEPLEQRNDGLTAKQQKALTILKNLITTKQNCLIKNGYLPDNAKVKRSEWRDSVMRTLFIQLGVMDSLEDDLWRMGAICYRDMHVLMGDWTPNVKAHTDNHDFILLDSTGRTFCQWFDCLDVIH